MILVKKRDGRLRAYRDHRHLSEITRRDAFPLRGTDAGPPFFPILDFSHGDWQAEVHYKDRARTASEILSGLYEF